MSTPISGIFNTHKNISIAFRVFRIMSMCWFSTCWYFETHYPLKSGFFEIWRTW